MNLIKLKDDKIDYIQVFRTILFAVLVVIVGASIVNFFHFRNLWHDEAMLAKSIVNRDFLELLEPLESNQVAPIGFVYMEKIFASIFNHNDWSLRIFPLLCFYASILLTYIFSSKIFKSTDVGIISAVLFAINPTLLFYSIEVKQYMCDVFFTLLLLNSYFIYSSSAKKNSIVLFAIICLISIWFSNTAIIIIFCLAIYQLTWLNTYTYKKALFPKFIPFIVGFLSFCTYYLFFILDHPSKDHMLYFWNKAAGFPPQNITSNMFYLFYYSRIKSILELLIEVKFYWLIAAFFIIIATLKSIKRFKILILIFGPVILHFVLAYFKIYPIATRLELYFFPVLISFLAYGIWSFTTYLIKHLNSLTIFWIVIPIIFNLYYIIQKVPFEKEEIKVTMSYIEKHINDDDQLYIYSTANQGFKYYVDQYPNITDKEYIWGTYFNGTNKEITEDSKNFGNSVWLLFSHVYYDRHSRVNDKDIILAFILKNGYYIEKKKVSSGSWAYKVVRR